MTSYLKSIWGYFVLCSAVFMWAQHSYSESKVQNRTPAGMQQLSTSKFKSLISSEPVWNTRTQIRNDKEQISLLKNNSRQPDAQYALGFSMNP